MKLIYSLVLVSGLSALAMAPSSAANEAQQSASSANKAAHKSYRATKVVPTMRNRVYTQLARAQALADAGDKAEGLAVLDEVKSRINSLNGYERAMLFNFYGFIYYGNDDIANANASFNQVVADESSIPNSLLISTLYSLAQISMQQQAYSQAISYLEKWQQVSPNKLNADQQILFAQAHYQNKAFEQSLVYINAALALVEQDNKIPKENWLTLQRAVYYELKKPAQVTQVLAQLVRYYDKDQYWLQLSAMYGEIGAEDKQMAVMEAAYQAGYVTKSSDILMLSQLYLFHGVPYKSAAVLEQAIGQGSIFADEDNLNVLARAYLAAKEDEQAIKVLLRVSHIAHSGKHDALLAQTYLNTQQWQAAIDASNLALARYAENKQGTQSKVKDIANMHLILGMANFNLKSFDRSLAAFSNASKFVSTKKTALQWGKYVEREQKNHQVQLAMLN